ncbi:amidohydrolase family protein [Barrientosiimonas humi]|uniref:amidohydrolase family protein n=1 Tax=Barrientosiimonas humi TaxID=999931 RepID=UPI001FD430B7|nr:amidohydrolase family protein [Barrientosiimonas humi]
MGNPRARRPRRPTIAQVATETGREPFDVCIQQLVDDRLATGILQHVGHEGKRAGDYDPPVAHRLAATVCSSAPSRTRAASGRSPRYLGRYCRELGIFSLEECVGHLTGRAARRLRLVDRGLVREGYGADLVLFDPDTVADRATFDAPRQPAAGFHHVLVRGQLALDDGHLTGARSGRALRRTDEGVR